MHRRHPGTCLLHLASSISEGESHASSQQYLLSFNSDTGPCDPILASTLQTLHSRAGWKSVRGKQTVSGQCQEILTLPLPKLHNPQEISNPPMAHVAVLMAWN